jgi:decaprenylphospho-beta-D-erythro-pentofuranosid-2-ulose 2-reductase
MNLLILGANSEVAQEIAKKFAQYEHADTYMCSRNLSLLEKSCTDIQIRYGVKAKPLIFDATDYNSHESFYKNLDPKPDGIVLAFGYLGDQQLAQRDFQEAQKIIETNLTGAVSILEIIAADFERRNHGFIIALSSVAGERGRKSNYIYGAAKGGLTIYLSGLRNRLYHNNVRVISVLPGMVRTKMTAHLNISDRLLAEPDEIAEDVYTAYKKNNDIIYTKWYWRFIMTIIKLIPEKLFKRLNLN